MPPANSTARLDITPVSALLLSIVILVLGNGLQGTLLGVRAGLEGFSPEAVGILMSGYFVGYAVGAFHCPGLIGRVGHIRAFAALASIASGATLMHAIVVDAVSWTLLRAANGYCYAGLIMVAESWLNGHALNETRGRLLAVYGGAMMAGYAASHLLINLADPGGFILFSVTSILISLALVPVTVARSSAPGSVVAQRFGLARLARISPIGVAGTFVGGLAMSAVSGMGPTFAQRIGLDQFSLSVFMAMPMLGALVLQWPIGWLSDRFDRRTVTLCVIFLAALVCAPLGFWAQDRLIRLLPLAFLFGGLVLPLYSLCIAHANDHITEEQRIPMASGLLLVYGAGAGLGPVTASLVMSRIGPQGLFLFAGALLAALLAFGLARTARRPPVPQGRQERFVAMPGTSSTGTHVALNLDPRCPEQASQDRRAPSVEEPRVP